MHPQTESAFRVAPWDTRPIGIYNRLGPYNQPERRTDESRALAAAFLSAQLMHLPMLSAPAMM